MKHRFVHKFSLAILFLLGAFCSLHAQSDSVWVEVFKEDFGGNDASAEQYIANVKEDDLKGFAGAGLAYSGSSNRAGVYVITKNSTGKLSNGDWNTGSDHTYEGDIEKGYYMRINPAGWTPDQPTEYVPMYVQELDGICSGVRFVFSAWMANIQVAGVDGIDPVLAVSINEKADGTGETYASAQMVLPKGSVPNVMPWQQLSLDFKMNNPDVDKAYFIVSAFKPDGQGFDFAIDDISIKVQHPTIEIEKEEDDFVFGDPLHLYTTFKNNGYFASTSGLMGRWYYSKTEDGEYEQIVEVPFSGDATFKHKITSSFDKDEHNGFYRLRIGNSGTFDSDVCSVEGTYEIAETRYKKRVHVCHDDVVEVDGYTVDAKKVNDKDVIEANTSLTIIVSKTVPVEKVVGEKFLCLNEEFEYNGKTYKFSQPETVEIIDTVKSIVHPDCDSIYEKFVIKATEEEEIMKDPEEICQGKYFNGRLYMDFGIYSDTVKEGCAFLITPLTVNPSYLDMQREFTICAGSTFEGEEFVKGGTFTRKYNKVSVDGCDSIVNATINVTDKIIVNLPDVVLCEGDEYVFGGKTYNKAGTYELESNDISVETGCDSITYQKVTINKMWSNENNPIDTFICYGSSVFGVTYEEPTVEPILIRDPQTYVSSTGCDSIVYYNLTVIEVELRLAIMSDRNTICRGEEVTINVSRLKPSDATLNWSHVFTGSKMKAVFQPDRDMAYVVVARNERAGCESADTMRVYVRDSPVLTIDTVDQKENHVEYSVEGGVEPYTMYLDKKERVEDPFGEVNNSFIGMHTLMVSDSSGCTSSQIYSISPVPIVPSTIFTPNGDGVNDIWTIENIDVYSDARVRIYDRNGKIIKEFYGYENETGWDGTYNGHLMPPTDYWYEINLPEVDTQYVGHFTLFYNIR